ncbi:unnamed protein product [Clonostachys solani]|uniref:Major facilitator superfamily (MFS) profile domain-containing protein n=1 Tax=Clonostachys solani TaxID=160281 RepID=A0A9N9Z1I8_9HYPO|nr:unnamed protein product [Clonostachys solani]
MTGQKDIKVESGQIDLDVENGITQEPIDPAITTTLKRKADFILLPLLAIAYLLNSLDRSNVANANTAGLEADLNLVGNQFNQVLTYYQVPFIVFGPLLTVVTKLIGAKYSISGMLFCFGIASLATGWARTFGHLVACRVIVGIFESGFLASVFYYLSVWYTRSELATRIGIFYGALVASSAFGGLLSYGMFQVTAQNGYFRWSYLFFLEGGLTVCWSLVVFFFLPSDVQSAWFLTESEKTTAIERLKRDSVESLDSSYTLSEFFTEFKAPHIYIRLISTFIQGVTLTSNANFLAMIIKGLHFSTIRTNLLTIAPALVGAITLICFCRSSDHFYERGYHIGGSLVLSFVGYIILYCGENKAWGVLYFAMFLCTMGAYPSTPLGATWTIANIPNLNARALTIGVYNSVGNCAGLLSSNIYISSEAPRYITSLRVNLAMAALGSFVSLAYGGWMRWENRRRDKKYGRSDNLTAGVSDTSDPNFRFQY